MTLTPLYFEQHLINGVIHFAGLKSVGESVENKPQVLTVNLGTGNGYSVLDMINAFEEASGQSVPYQIVDRRPGDIETCYADPTYAAEKLGWKAEYELDEMCEDTWRWQSQNPNGCSKHK